MSMSANRGPAWLLAVLVLGATLAWPAPADAADEVFTPFAGTGEAGFGGDGGPATRAQLADPSGLAVAADGTVYIADTNNHRVRAVSPDGVISTVAGTGQAAPFYAVLPDSMPAAQANLSLPYTLTVGPDGTVYIADTGLYRVFALSADGRLTVVAGTGRIPSDGDGRLAWGKDPGPAGAPATSWDIKTNGGLAVGPDGTVYIGDRDGRRVWAVSPAGIITVAAGNGDRGFAIDGGPATSVPVGSPVSLAVDRRGDLWIVDDGGVQRLSDGWIATLFVDYEGAQPGWGLAESGGPPPPGRLAQTVFGVATAGDDVYLLDGAKDVLGRLGAGNRLEKALPYDPLSVRPSGQVAVTESGVGYVADLSSGSSSRSGETSGQRVYSFRVARPGPQDQGSGGSPWWPYPAAAGTLLVFAGGWLLIRRRRIH
jgi:NHL repeat